MRIISGDFRGRKLMAPAGTATRPTSDRIREALFSHLEANFGSFEGRTVLDAFAGTGALGLEALSRGAAHATFVETGHDALQALAANITACHVEQRATVVRGNLFTLTSRLAPYGPFDLLFFDPPYVTPAADMLRLFEAFRQANLIEPGAYIMYEHQRNTPLEWPAAYNERHAARYGKTVLSCALVEKEK